jgi:hypothetical protein
MRWAGTGLIVAVLALAGCKSTDSKSGDDKSSGNATGRSKQDAAPAKTPSWLDDVARLPGGGIDIPKGTVTNDPKVAAQEELSGRVLDPDGRPARNIIVRVEEVGAPAPFETGVMTNNDGYFRSPGKPGRTYDVTVQVTLEGRKLVGSVQTRVPRSALEIRLREDPNGAPFPPAPKPSDSFGDTGLPPKATPENGWSPGGSAGTVPPANIGGGTGAPSGPKPPANGGLPPPDPSEFPSGSQPMTRSENVADAPKLAQWPPPASIPGPGGPLPVPTLPALPPSFNAPGSGRSSMIPLAPNKFALVDTLDRPWSLDSAKPGELVLVEFMESEKRPEAVAANKPCQTCLPVLKDLQSRYGASGLQVVAVMCDELPQRDRAALAAKYTQDNNLNYAVYVEPGAAGSIRDRIGVTSYPDALLLDSTGKVLWRGHPGDRAKLEAAIKQNMGN